MPGNPLKAQFRNNLARSVGASGISLALTLVSTPIVARLFPPEAYGVNGLMVTAATLLSGFGLLGFPVALARVNDEGERAKLLDASAQVAVLLALACAVAAAAALLLHPALTRGLSAAVLVIFPFLVLLYCIQRVTESLLTSKGEFRSQASATVANSLVARGMTVLLGWLVSSRPLFMLTGDALGKVALALVNMRGGNIENERRALRWRPNLRFLRGMIAEFRQFALQSNMATAMPLIIMLGIQTTLGTKLSLTVVGHYVFAQSVLTLPVTLIAMATAPVVFHYMSQTADQTPHLLLKLTLNTLIIYLVIGTVCMAPIMLFGPPLFAFVFGEPWQTSGEFASILAISQVMVFSLTGLLSLFRVTHQLNTWLVVESAGAIVVLGGLQFLYSNAEGIQVVSHLMHLLLLYYGLMHVGLIWAVGMFARRQG